MAADEEDAFSVVDRQAEEVVLTGDEGLPVVEMDRRFAIQETVDVVVEGRSRFSRSRTAFQPTALATWFDITPLARNDWNCWVENAQPRIYRMV